MGIAAIFYRIFVNQGQWICVIVIKRGLQKQNRLDRVEIRMLMRILPKIWLNCRDELTLPAKFGEQIFHGLILEMAHCRLRLDQVQIKLQKSF